MFSSNPLDKSCIGPDCSSGRSNASSRFPVGITSLGDENQHIRIQLAVHKYNSSPSGSLNNKYGVITPFRHSFLSNPTKIKNYEGDAEGTSKAEKNGNQYEGVGAFPTIHLKKKAVRYRPFRRFNDVKISHPELPVNRFLNNSLEKCTDVKSSTRSVLDVLEDLSGKKIHAQDHNGSGKVKTKGLGGDCLLNPNALYKPLFVQKPKLNTVLTRDSTTQTLSALSAEKPSPQSSFIRNDISDPKAELRRKLAKQNNEIFASLSSSISSFNLKRKIDKFSQADDENLRDGSATKNLKMDHQTSIYDEFEISKSTSRSKTGSNKISKLNRKINMKETNSPTSPNKDRLTTIFLDMQNTSPKVQMFQNNINITLPDSKSSLENASQLSMNNSFTNIANSSKSLNPFVNGSTENNSTESSKSSSNVKNFPSLNAAEKTSQMESKKSETDQLSKLEFNFSINQVSAPLNDGTKSSSVNFQLENNSSISGYSIPKTSVQSDSNCKDISKTMANNNSAEKTNSGSQVLGNASYFSSVDKTDFSCFTFETNRNSTSTLSEFSNDSSKINASAVKTTSSTTPQSSLGAISNPIISAPQPFASQFEVPSAQNKLASPTKPLFAFGKNNALPQQNSEKPSMSNNLSTLITTPNIQSGAFNFGQNSTTDSSVKTSAVASFVTSTSQSTNATFSSSESVGTKLSTDPTVGLQANKTSFTFGNKTETSAALTVPGTPTQDSKFSFSFNQKSTTVQNKEREESEPKNKNLFSFGQKPFSQAPENNTTSANTTPSSQPSTTLTTSMFAPNASAPIKFAQIPASQTTNNFGAKSEGISLGISSTPAFSESNSSFPMKTSLFGSSNGGFGGLTTEATTAFKTSTSNAPSFTFGTSIATQPTPTFGVSSASQAAPAFGTPSAAQSVSGFGSSSSTTQSTSMFGTSSTPAFGIPATTHSTSTFPVTTTTTTTTTAQSGSTFGIASTTQSVSAFGIASASQSTPSFGMSSTTQSTPAFGTSAPQTASGFGTSVTQSIPAFGTPLGFGVSTSSKPNTGFGAPTATQSTVRFGAPAAPSNTTFGASTGFTSTPSTQKNPTFGVLAPSSTPAFGVSQSSFSQTFDNKPTTSLGQTSNIFGQNPSSSFSSTPAFSSSPNNIFEAKPNAEGVFDQSKIQAPAFGSTSQSFGSPNKFSFGMSTSNATGFTTSSANTTSPPVFSFGSTTTPNTFTFGSGPSTTNNTQTQFAFKSPANEPFKFGAATTKEGPEFGGNTGAFAFGGQMNNNAMTTEQKPPFSFGSSQVSSAAPFAFGTTPSPSVFSFGGSTSASSGSSFNFGTPTPGGPFGQSSTPSPGAPFAVPGTFSIGSGSSQSRPRAMSRPRRRP